MKLALAMMYEDILEFHRRALRVFSKPSNHTFSNIHVRPKLINLAWRQLFRATWKDFDTHFLHILKDLARHKALIESQATLIHFQEAQLDRVRGNKLLEKVETEAKHDHHIAVLDWLSPTDASLDQTAASDIRRPIPETGLWILDEGKVKVWCQTDVPKWPTLWMYGIPGAGT